MLFFLSQSILIGALFFMDYKKEIKALDETIFNKMRVCSFDLKCDGLELDFVKKEKFELYKLYKNEDILSAYFSIATSNKNSLKVYLTKETYLHEIEEIKEEVLLEFVLVLLFVFLLSILFGVYTINPLRNALRLTEEFIKDILHDFNTPLSTLRLNVSMLKEDFQDNAKIKRIENSVQNILNLQSNLRSYLHESVSQKDSFPLKDFLQERVELVQGSYKNIEIFIEVKQMQVHTNRDALARVIDNLLVNAAKYNKKDGKITLKFEANILKIIDTGKGIKQPQKVFNRFYKEQERGIGIGLHIVNKLCEELDIGIDIESEVGVGSTFSLNLEKII